MKNLENSSLKFLTIREFLIDLKQEFRDKDNKSVKIVELKKVKQGNKTMEEFFRSLEEQQEIVVLKKDF